MKTFIEILNEGKSDWYAEDGSITRDGSKMSSINITFNNGWSGYGTNAAGDVDDRGFSDTNINRAASKFTKEFKLKFGSMAAKYLLAAAKEYSTTNKSTANLTSKFINNGDFDTMDAFIKKYS